jgi:hypothetical protein
MESGMKQVPVSHARHAEQCHNSVLKDPLPWWGAPQTQSGDVVTSFSVKGRLPAT